MEYGHFRSALTHFAKFLFARLLCHVFHFFMQNSMAKVKCFTVLDRKGKFLFFKQPSIIFSSLLNLHNIMNMHIRPLNAKPTMTEPQNVVALPHNSLFS